LPHQGDRLQAISGLSDHFDAGIFQETTEAISKNGVIVGNYDT
jgi:hypothetical protein